MPQLLLLVYILLIFLVGLWPMNFTQINQVKWLTGRNGIVLNKEGLGKKFSDRGIAFSETAINWPTDKALDFYSIEILLKPLEKRDRILGVILCIYDDKKLEKLRIERWQQHLIIQARHENKKQYRKIGVNDVLLLDKKAFITLTMGQRNLKLYINGELKREVDNFSRDQTIGMNFGKIVLGADAAGGSPWCGEIYGLALYSDTLDVREVNQNYDDWQSGHFDRLSEQSDLVSLYSFSEGSGNIITDHTVKHNDIIIPENYRTLRYDFLTLPGEYFEVNRSFIMDIIINLLGFIPFGFLLISLISKNSSIKKRYVIYIIVGLASFLVSLSIEYLQIYLPQRSSSVIDLIVNTMGGIIGVFLYFSTRYRITISINFLK